MTEANESPKSSKLEVELPILNNTGPLPRLESSLLVIGLSGRVGCGVSFVRDKILQNLKSFNYQVEIVDVTDIMEKFKSSLSNDTLNQISSHIENLKTEYPDIKDNQRAIRVCELQLIGNALRLKYTNSILAALSVSEFIIPNIEEKKAEGIHHRTAFLIDSLKHPEETNLLRQIFGNLFWLVGVVSSDMTRSNRLVQRKGFSNSFFEYISEQDADGKDLNDVNGKYKNGQRTVDCVLDADYFFSNDYLTKDEIESEAARLTRLIFNIQVVSPRQDEVGMNTAFQASLRSACLSRQVGAAIIGERGELLSTGHNDVPKFGGGLYGPVPSDEDKRCWTFGAKCYNDEEKDKISREIIGLLVKAKQIDNAKSEEAVKLLASSRIKVLIEFTRAVHAEMEAMISIARLGINGIVGSTLYTTTYPCHNCAKHIIDAGIAKVVYMEPYEKSLARSLHPDAINDSDHESSDCKVRFESYGGVSPKRFDEVFKPVVRRKNNGIFNDQDRHRIELTPHNGIEADVLDLRLDDLKSWVDKNFNSEESPPNTQTNFSN